MLACLHVSTASLLHHYIILYCIVLYCIVLYCIVLYCIALHCIALHCIALHCIALHCIALHCIALHCIALHYITLHYITLHYITLHYITLHYITLHYITLHYNGLNSASLCDHAVSDCTSLTRALTEPFNEPFKVHRRRSCWKAFVNIRNKWVLNLHVKGCLLLCEYRKVLFLLTVPGYIKLQFSHPIWQTLCRSLHLPSTVGGGPPVENRCIRVSCLRRL